MIRTYIKEIFGFSGQIAILCSIIATVICFIIMPQDLRKRFLSHISTRRRRLIFKVKTQLVDNKFTIKGCKRNDKIINYYFIGKYDNLFLRIIDYRKFGVIKSIICNEKIRKQNILKLVLEKIHNQHLICKESIECLLLDKSAINSEVYRGKYRYNDLIESIINYNIQDKVKQENIHKVNLFFLKTKQNKLKSDIEFKIDISKEFSEKYSGIIHDLYFGRGNMDIYDLDIKDFIKYIAPQFYSFISAIRNGEWVYSKLDLKYYQIDHFEFDLNALYKLCEELGFYNH